MGDAAINLSYIGTRNITSRQGFNKRIIRFLAM